MKKKKILYVTQEMQPYTALSEIANIARKLPQKAQGKGMEIRVLMPRFGTINERRHRLHEVVRLSGMNIVVDDDDYPLIIKVASLPGARMQVYFLDNEEFFKRKSLFTDAKEKPFKDNGDRSIFFCKGVLETVKKFGWPPDLIHCHGWMTSLIPAYVKTAYKNEPIFKDSKVIYSLYNNNMAESFTSEFVDKAIIQNVKPEELEPYRSDKAVLLDQGAIHYADALIKASESLDQGILDAVEASGKPSLDYIEGDAYQEEYMNLYRGLLENEG